jgi:hypothetical protein
MKCVLCGEETSGTYNRYPICCFHYENGEDLSMLDTKEITNG